MNRMKELRESMGISMREAAKRLLMPYTTYVNYEKGLREPNSEALIQIAVFFDTSIDYLLGREGSHRAADAPNSIVSIPEAKTERSTNTQSLSAAEMTHIKKYRALDQDGKDTVEAVLDCEHKRCTRRPNIVTEPTVLKFAGRDGSFREYTLSPQELEALRQKLAELPDASDDL